MSKKHIMIDLETWGTGPFSVITQIGAAEFDPNKDGPMDGLPMISNSFEVCVDPVSSQKMGLRVDAATVAWWMDPERNEAREQWFRTLKFELPLALDGFEQWLDGFSEIDERVIWGNGSDFDNALLKDAYAVAQRDPPWRFYNNRCFRTFKNLSPTDVRPQRDKVAHTALADVIYQIEHFRNVAKVLGVTI